MCRVTLSIAHLGSVNFFPNVATSQYHLPGAKWQPKGTYKEACNRALWVMDSVTVYAISL